jgi:hypothetical protein
MMPLRTTLNLGDLTLTELEERRIRRQLEGLGRRLARHPQPSADIVLRPHPGQRQTRADMRVQLGSLGPHLVSHQLARTPDRAVRLAVDDIQRQLERRLAQQRGEPSYAVPSRRGGVTPRGSTSPSGIATPR